MPRISLFQSRPSSQASSQTPNPGSTTKNTIKNALIILEKAVDGLPVPGLKAAIGSLVEIIKIVDKAKQNQDALQELVVHLRRLGDAITTAFLDCQHLGISPELEARVNRLSEELSKLVNDWQRLKTAHTFSYRFINYEDYSLAVNDMNRRIRESLDTFLLENQIAATIAIENIQRTISKHVLSNEIRSLPRANASYNSLPRDNAPTCLEGTREGVLNDFRRWFFTGSTFMYVLLGIAGVGKSTIAQTIAAFVAQDNQLAASFFFSRYENERSTSQLLFSSLTYQLAQKSQDFAERISRALQASPDAPHQTLSEQLRKLIIEPLEDLPDSMPPMLIVLDALDECEEKGAAHILQLLLDELPRLPFVKIFLTSRPEPHLKPIIDKADSQDGLVLHDIERSVVEEDIGRFLNHQLSQVEVEKALPGCGWSCAPKDIETLVSAAGRLFIVASTCDKYIKDKMVRDPQYQLSRLLRSVTSGAGANLSPFATLDKLYLQILEAAITGDQPDEFVVERFQNVVGTIIILQDPLTPQALAGLLCRPITYINAVLDVLQSIIVSSHQDPCPRIYHPSFPDFITSPTRCHRDMLLIDAPKHHARLAGLCLDLMNRLLKRNICGLTYPDKFMENNDIPDLPTKIKAHVPPELVYASCFWALHLSKCRDNDDELVKKLEQFAFNRLLYWLEVLSLIGRMEVAYPAVTHAHKFALNRQKIRVSAPPELITILHDAQRLVMSSQEIVRMSALHVYYSALPFVPRETVLFRKYENEAKETVRVLVGEDTDWDPLLAVLVGHSDIVNSVAFSPDGTYLISASDDNTIRLWDSTTCTELAKFEDHSDKVKSALFSPNGTRFASACDDNTVRLWNAATGAPLAKLEGHSNSVASVVFSPDGTRLASTSSDNTVRLWDAATNEPIATLQGHSNWVRSASFSPNSTLLASASWDKTVRLWDAVTGAPLAVLQGHSYYVNSVVFSPCGTRIASASLDKTIRLWDSATGAPLAELQGHSHFVISVVYSPDGTLLASASTDKTIHLWDAETGTILARLEGHSSAVSSVVFSPDGARLASASSDRTVRLWEVHTPTGASLVNREGHSDWVTSIVFSPDGTRLASASVDSTIQLWDGAACVPLATLRGHSDCVISVVFSPDSTLLASASWDETLVLWDAATGAPLTRLEGHSSMVSLVIFSPDGTHLASTAEDKTIRLWDVAEGTPFATLEGHSDAITSLKFSPDGTRLVSTSDDKTVRLWNVATGTPLNVYTGTLTFTPDRVYAVLQQDGLIQTLWEDAPATRPIVQDSHLTPLYPSATGPDPPSKPLIFFRDNRTRSFVICKMLQKEAGVFVRVPLCWLPFSFADGVIAFRDGIHDWKGSVLAAGFGNGRMLFLDTSPIELQ